MSRAFSTSLSRHFGENRAIMVLSACSQQEVVDSTGAAAKNWCRAVRNCTVDDDNAVR
jgi:hypothetical protein